MSRRKLSERNTRKLQRLGSSISVTLPVEIVRKLKWREKQKVKVRQVGKKVVIEDWEG